MNSTNIDPTTKPEVPQLFEATTRHRAADLAGRIALQTPLEAMRQPDTFVAGFDSHDYTSVSNPDFDAPTSSNKS